MGTTTVIEKEQLITENYTPLKTDFFSGGEEISMDSSNSLEQIPTVFKNPQEISIETGNDHVLDIEVSPFMDARQEVANVDSDLKDFVSPIDSTGFRSFEKVSLPLTEDKINEGLKKPIWSSFRWLAEFTKALFLRRKVQTA